MKHLHTSNLYGFSLTSVMVAAVLVGFLSIVLMKVMENSQKGQQTVVNTAEFTILKSSIHHVLMNPNLCATAFIDAATPAAPLTYTDMTGPSYPSALQAIPKIRLGASATSPIVAEITPNPWRWSSYYGDGV